MTAKDSIEKEKPEWLSQMETVLEVHKEGVPRFPTRTSLSEQDRAGLLLTLVVYSNPKWLTVVRATVERLTETLSFPAIERSSITRAVDEALTNIVRHSYGNRLDQPIVVYFRKTQRPHDGQVQNGLEILLCDRGPAVDRDRLQGRPLEEIRPGGLGLHFIRQAMDTVEFTRKGSGASKQRSLRQKAQ